MGVDIGFIPYSEEYEKKYNQYNDFGHITKEHPAYTIKEELENWLYPEDNRLLSSEELLKRGCPKCSDINGERYSNFSMDSPVNIEDLGCHLRFTPEKKTWFPKDIKHMLNFMERCLFAYPEDAQCKKIFNILKECLDNNLFITTC